MSHNFERGLRPATEHLLPENTHSVRDYLLEKRLLKLIENQQIHKRYNRLHQQTGLGLYEIEKAFEDTPYILTGSQLRLALTTFENEGLVALLRFLQTPFEEISPIVDEELLTDNYIPLSQLIDQWPKLCTIGGEAFWEDLAHEGILNAKWEDGGYSIRLTDALAYFDLLKPQQ